MVHPCAKGEEEAVRSPTFSEDLFSSAITRERKRTERSGLAIVLILICREERDRNSDVPEIWNGVGDAVRAVKSDIDMVGWFEQDTVPSEVYREAYLSTFVGTPNNTKSRSDPKPIS